MLPFSTISGPTDKHTRSTLNNGTFKFSSDYYSVNQIHMWHTECQYSKPAISVNDFWTSKLAISELLTLIFIYIRNPQKHPVI